LLLVSALSLGQVFVQEISAVANSATSVSATYATAETAGNLNVVVIGWNDSTSSVTSVADDNSNTYLLVGTSTGNGQSQAIYYAANIGLPTNNTPTVTVTFNHAASFPDLRILEYSGLSATLPLDNWAGNAGSSALADSGSAVTSASDLILGAGTTATRFNAPGTGFTLREITPFFDIVEDSNAALTAGTYNATAVLSSGTWVMQVAAFSTTPVTFTNPPTISSTTPITPASGSDAGGTSVIITGTNFQPGAVVLFGTAPAISGANCTESGGTTITCLTPADSDGAKDITVVNVDGQLSTAAAAYTFQNVTPVITTITPATGPTNGRAITITGSNFQAGAAVTIGGLPVGDLVIHDPGNITANTPGLPVGAADVTIHNPGGGTVTKTGGFTYVLGSGPINYIQKGSAAPSTPSISVPVTMPNAQTAGNLNVVIIGWADTVATVSSVADAEGNTYVAALPATVGTGLSQVIYYATNIKGDTGTPNQVTITFSQAAQFPDLRILEYSGLDTASPLDVVASTAGSGTLADTGPCTTTTPVELIVAGGTVGTLITNAGTGFTLLHITQPNGNNAEQQITSVAGSCQATAPLEGASDWVMQAVAFKVPPPPTPDFSLGAIPTSQTVIAGSPASYAISVTALNGFNSAVTLDCDALSLPTGAACGFVPNPVTPGGAPAASTLTISTTAATPAGTSSVTVNGTAGSVTHSMVLSLTVNPPPDFSIAATTPAPVVQGASATSTITISAANGFTNTVALSCSSITPVVTPAPTCAFVPTSVLGGSGSSALTISTGATTPAGPYSVIVTGTTTGSVSHTTSISLTVNTAAAADFTIAAAAFSPATVTAGGSATSTITIAPVNGFTGTVNLACAITPAATPAPTCSFSPNPIAGGSTTSTLTFKTTAATSASLAPWRGIFYVMWLPIGGLALLGKGSKWSRKQLLGLLLAFLMVSGLIFLAACGGGSSSGGGGGGGHPGTPAGAYTVTVTATSGALTHPATATVTVQ